MGTESAGGCGVAPPRIPLLFLVTLWCVFNAAPSPAQDSPYCEELLASAAEQKLHEDRYWHILVHYQNGLFGIKSLVDDPMFFLSPEGRTDPEAEIRATIRAFFEQHDNENDSAMCRFPARFEWIRERLDIDPDRIPLPACRSFENFMKTARPSSVTLVFPMAHLNSPASMFGHTLLTVETADRTSLLAYSISYSAVTRETFGPFFAFKGLFGLYPGYFAVLPYYSKLEQYSDVDHRDIWEYRLNLTAPEIRRMLLHVRELESIASDYYFFQENCSYLLYFLLEAARPSLELSDRFHWWLIPLDSIRAIEEQGLITGASYRPSRTTKIRFLASNLSEQGQTAALAMADGMPHEDALKCACLSDQEKKTTCELAGEYLQYLYSKRRVSEETYQERFLAILTARSRLGTAPGVAPDETAPPVQPDRGHRSNRLALGTGVKGDDAFAELRIRPAYHHLMDLDDGYVEGAQLIFADAALRYYPEDRRLLLESLDVIDILSLSPRDRFFRPVSWKLDTGLIRVYRDDDESHLVYQINPGGGLAFGITQGGLFYGMLETGLNLGGALEKRYALGTGGSAGIIRVVGTSWKIHARIRDVYYGLGDSYNLFEAALQQSIAIGPGQSVRADISWGRTGDFSQTEFRIFWNLFF
jgi:hypothetical protein